MGGVDENFENMCIEDTGFGFGRGSAWVGFVASMGAGGSLFAWREFVRMGLGSREVVAAAAAA